jgi:hypothetical protein
MRLRGVALPVCRLPKESNSVKLPLNKAVGIA